MCLTLYRSLVCDIVEVDRDLIRLATSRPHELPSEGSGRRTFFEGLGFDLLTRFKVLACSERNLF